MCKHNLDSNHNNSTQPKINSTDSNANDQADSVDMRQGICRKMAPHRGLPAEIRSRNANAKCVRCAIEKGHTDGKIREDCTEPEYASNAMERPLNTLCYV